MQESSAAPRRVSRRGVLKATAAGAIASMVTPNASAAAAVDAPASLRSVTAASPGQSVDPDFRRLDEFIREAMGRYDVPGLAFGVLHEGREYTNGYGITNRNAPLPVDAHTLLQTGSITKTYTATLMMRLVEMGKAAPSARRQCSRSVPSASSRWGSSPMRDQAASSCTTRSRPGRWPSSRL
jgi:CubicO group peptidase (beta-lactamase class C family)